MRRRPEVRDAQNLLQEYQRVLERALRVHLPRRFSRAYLERTFGPARYRYDTRALERAIADPVWDLLDRGGKRWRPVFFLLTLRLFGKQPRHFLEMAAVFELIHNGTLIVDDVEDSSLLRRGRATLHRVFGIDIAVNAGNALYVLPLLHVLSSSRYTPTLRLDILDACLRDLVRLHAGQGMDIAWHRNLLPTEAISERQYLQMCAYKTGCLARMAGTVAALIGKATQQQRAAVAAFAETLGVVFQIQDDVLNITESAVSQQKGLGDDITEGKRSLLVLYTVQRAPVYKRKRLLEILDMHTSDQRLRDEAIAIIRSTDALPRAQRTMQRLFRNAWRAFDRAFPASAAKDDLQEFSRFLVERAG